MPTIVKPPATSITFDVRALSNAAFSAFGTVIENSEPRLSPSPHIKDLPANAVLANQGSAIKYKDVTHMMDLYGSSPSKVPSKAVMNMFDCGPRELSPSADGEIQGYFQVDVLERHPFTTQTFIPLGLSAEEREKACFLVVVAPSREASSADQHLPVPSTPSAGHAPRRGLPDLTQMQAFIAKGSQAVTYGAGTWHAPMVVIGRQAVDFVVVQFANGVEIEDCQEVSFASATAQLRIAVPQVKMGLRRLDGVAKL